MIVGISGGVSMGSSQRTVGRSITLSLKGFEEAMTSRICEHAIGAGIDVLVGSWAMRWRTYAGKRAGIELHVLGRIDEVAVSCVKRPINSR